MCASGTLAIDEELNAILQSHQHHPDVPLRMQMVTSTVDSSLQGLPPVRYRPFALQSSQLSLNGGFLSGLFGSHSPEHQRVALSTSTTRLVNSIDAFIQQRCTQSSGTSGEAASKPQALKPHSHEKRQSSRSSGDRMDIDEESPGRKLPGSTVMLGPHKSSLAESIQSSGGLMRYHSAPSSILPSHVEVGEELFPRVSCPMKQTDDSDFARFFVDDVSPATANSGSRGTQPVEKSQTGCAPAGVEAEQQLLRNSDLDRKLPQQSRYRRPSGNGIVEELNRVPLSAIYEHGPDLSPDNFYSSQISVTGKQRGARKGHTVGVGSLVSESSSLNPHISSSAGFTATPENRSNLIRHRSSPAGLLSRLAKEVQGESGERPGPCFTGPLMQPPAECLPERISEETAFGPSARRPEGAPGFPVTSSYVEARLTGDTCNDHVANVGVLGLPSVPINNCLLRQSSSPAGLPSQLTLDGIAEGCDKLVMPSLHRNSAEEVGYDGRGGHVTFLSSYPIEGWDEEVAATGDAMVSMQNGTAFAARKRVREMEAKMFPGLTSPDLQQRDVSELGPLSNQFSITTTSPERALTAEKFAADSVLCRARAKRGCATHPRSIAERVRRTKISERMRKLQELVPNMDKQTNIADMLDEAVEYVKLLQRQIQELSENRPKCDGSCKKQ